MSDRPNKLPGFSAETTLYRRTGYYRAVGIVAPTDGTVYPSACTEVCTETCVGTGEERRCWDDCSLTCDAGRGGPGRGGPVGHPIS